MSVWDSYTGGSSFSPQGQTQSSIPSVGGLYGSNTPQTAQQSSSGISSWYDPAKWDVNNPLAGLNSFKATGFVPADQQETPITYSAGGNGWTQNPLAPKGTQTYGHLTDAAGTSHLVSKNPDGTYSYDDVYDNPSGKSNRDKLNVSYIYNPKTGLVTPSSAKTGYQAGDWVSEGQPAAQFVGTMAAAGLGIGALGGAGAGVGVGAADASTTGLAPVAAEAGEAGYLPAAGNGLDASFAGGEGLTGIEGGEAAALNGVGSGGTSLGQLGQYYNTAKTIGGLAGLTGATGGGSKGGNVPNSSAGSSPLNDFISSLTGDTSGINWGNLLSGAVTAGSAYNAGKNANDLYTNQINQINSLYAPDSPYAQQMQQTMDRKDAAAGRNSQYGTRATELAANLTNSKAQALNSANMTNLLGNKINAQNQFPATLAALLGGGATGNRTGMSGTGESAGTQFGNYLANLFKGGSGPAVSNTTPGVSGLPDYAIMPDNSNPYSGGGNYSGYTTGQDQLPDDSDNWDLMGNWGG